MSKNKKLPRGIDRFRGAYRARISVDGRQWTVGVFPKLGDARAALEIAWSQKARGTFVPPPVRKQAMKALRKQEQLEALTVRQWAGMWLEALQSDPERPRSPGTITSYQSTLDVHVLDELGSMNLKDVSEDDIERVVEMARFRNGKRSDSASRNVARTVRTMFNSAVKIKAGGLEVSPVTLTISKPARVDITADQRTATPAEVNAMKARMPANLSIAVLLGAWCAMRLGEVLGLQRHDFKDLDQPERATVRIDRQWLTKAKPPRYAPPKSDSMRVVSVPAAIVPLIVEHLRTYVAVEPSSSFLPSPRTSKQPISQTQFDKHWRASRDQVKPGFRFHDLRHTGLTAYAQQGATLKEIMNRGGHTDVAVAMRYQDVAQSRDHELTAKLNAQIGG